MSKIALAGNASGTGTITIESPNTNTDFTINLPAASGTLVTTGGTVTFGAGTAAAPSITNTNDTNTGIYFPAPDTIGFTEGGVESFRLNSSGEGVFAGNVTAAGNVTVAGGVQVGGITTNVYPLVSGTAQTALGTFVDFTGIPSWVKRITVMFNGISTNGTSNLIVQLGTAGGIETTSYSGGVSIITGGVAVSASSIGFLATQQRGAADISTGSMIISNVSGNVWLQQSVVANNSGHINTGAGGKTLSNTLTQVRITTVNGTDAFDAGTINIMYE
jgi:hypothetical protein